MVAPSPPKKIEQLYPKLYYKDIHYATTIVISFLVNLIEKKYGKKYHPVNEQMASTLPCTEGLLGCFLSNSQVG